MERKASILEYFSIKIHGSKAALNFIPDIT